MEIPVTEAAVPFRPGESPFHAKGTLWLGIRAFIEHRVVGGTEAVSRFLSPPFAEFLTQLFVASGWYDIMPILTIANAAAAALNVDKLEYVRQSALHHAEQDMAGVYKGLLTAATPVALCRRFASIQSQIYDFGKVQIVKEETHRVESVATGMPEALTWWWRRASEYYMYPVLRACGARDPRIVWSASQPDGSVSKMPLVRFPSYTAWS